MAERVPCRCLLDEAHPDLARTVRDYVESLPPDLRTPEDAYRRRLAVCVGCPRLRDGTCARCGCYAEARAAKRGQRCPDTPPRWLPLSGAGADDGPGYAE